MRTALSRYCLAALVSAALPNFSHASLAYSAKREGAEVFRSDKLEPPPLAGLSQGQPVRLISKGTASSLIETVEGIKGWVRNEDLLAIADAPDRRHVLKDQNVTGGDVNISPWIPALPPAKVTPDDLERSFLGELPERLDREQVEMRHGEN